MELTGHGQTRHRTAYFALKENMNVPDKIKLIECPRDAMQGWKTFITTEKKVEYINSLLKVGFDTIDFWQFCFTQSNSANGGHSGSDYEIEIQNTNSKLLAIVANSRGAEEASIYDAITYWDSLFQSQKLFSNEIPIQL